MASTGGGGGLSSSEFKRKKELDEARRNGTLPPEQDADGNLINPHNPEYISKRPWYLGDSESSLKHQTLQNQSHLLSIHEADDLYLRGKKQAVGFAQAAAASGPPRKWRKGACKNCGAMSHKTVECVERPRKVGAWKTNKDLQSDEVLVDVRSQQYGKLAYDAKRDQWLGYDPKDHTQTIQRYDNIDAARKKLRMEQVDKDLRESSKKKKSRKEGEEAPNSDSDSDYESDAPSSEDDEFRDRDEGPMFTERVARQGGVGGAQMKTTVRNLRIREDTAKYLRNLNPESAYYDPKTRSMRDNPNPELNPEDTAFIGDNMVRFTGDAEKLASQQMFAWEGYTKGVTEIHPLANPSQAEFMKKQYELKKAALEQEKKRKILDKYGGQAHLEAPPRELLLAQSESYVEYSRDGRVVKGLERAPVRSKYVEDVLENNHTLIWGSWYDRRERSWGYACCHSKVRKSYCTGEEGKRAMESVAAQHSVPVAEQRAMLPPKEASSESSGKDDSGASVLQKRSEMYGENVAVDLDAKKLKKAMKKVAKQQAQAEMDDKKRKYNSMSNYEVEKEEMEAYKLLKTRGDDPMAKFLGKDDVLDE